MAENFSMCGRIFDFILVYVLMNHFMHQNIVDKLRVEIIYSAINKYSVHLNPFAIQFKESTDEKTVITLAGRSQDKNYILEFVGLPDSFFMDFSFPERVTLIEIIN